MAGSTNKKVLVARFDRETLAGFVQTPGGLSADGLELLTPEGKLLHLPYSETKAVCFVREFDGAGWREHRCFAARPKSAGLWVRLLFRDGDSMEGVLSGNLMLLDPTGFSIVPPDPTFQNQKIFVPRAALEQVQVLGVIGAAPRKRTPKPARKDEEQMEMFDQEARSQEPEARSQ